MWYEYIIHTTEFSTHFIPWKSKKRAMERKGISVLFTGCLQYAYLISFFRPALISLPGHIGQYIFFGLISEHFLIKCYFKKWSWIQHFHTALHSLDYWRWLCLDGPWKGQHVKCASSQKQHTVSVAGFWIGIPGSNHSGVLLLATIAAKIWWTSQNTVLYLF